MWGISWGVRTILGCGQYLGECLGVLEISLGVGNILGVGNTLGCWEYLEVLGISWGMRNILGSE